MMWSSDEIVQATGGTLSGPAFTVKSVSIDSRKAGTGALFAALKGEKFDGHDFIKAALANGAGAVLAERVPEGVKGSFILVADVYEALISMAHAARKRFGGHIIAVTGSVGKTGTKEAIRTAAASAGKVYATHGNLNNHIGLPLSLCNLPRDAAFGVFELGMNHAGEIAFLTKMAQPHIAVITNVEAVHLEFFSGVEAIAAAKAEIMEGMTPEGTVVLNHDNAAYGQLLAVAEAKGIKRIISFGEHEEADCRLMDYAVEQLGSRIEARIFAMPLTYRLATTGRHWALASLAALAAVTSAGADLANSAAALAHFQEPDGRGKLHSITLKQGAVITIDDCYNASPASVKAAIAKLEEVQQSLKADRTIAVLGDMLELGSSSEDLHRSLLAPLQAHGVTKVFAAGKFMKSLYDMLPVTIQGGYAKDAAALAPLVVKAMQAGDVVLIKGSRGSRMDIVRDALQNASTSPLPKETANAL